jgi:hypothetical protein
MLAISTMAFKHLDLVRSRRTFIAHRAANASASKRSFDHKESRVLGAALCCALIHSTNGPVFFGQAPSLFSEQHKALGRFAL